MQNSYQLQPRTCLSSRGVNLTFWASIRCIWPASAPDWVIFSVEVFIINKNGAKRRSGWRDMQFKVPFPLESTHLGYRCTMCAFSPVRRATCLSLSTCSGRLWSQHQLESRLGSIWLSDVWEIAPLMQKGACFGFCPVSPPWQNTRALCLCTFLNPVTSLLALPVLLQSSQPSLIKYRTACTVTTNHGTSLSVDCKYEPQRCV
jgi:hypothetical protein